MECGDATEISGVGRAFGAVIVDLFPSSPAFVAQGPKTAETPANTRHVGVAWIPL